MREDEFGAFSLYTGLFVFSNFQLCTCELSISCFLLLIDKYTYDLKIPHEGIVQTARYMPDNTNMIATKSNTDMFIYDISQCTVPTTDEVPLDDAGNNLCQIILRNQNITCFFLERECEPIYEYTGLNSTSELVWNPEKEALLLTGFKKDQVAIWDINHQNSTNGRKSSLFYKRHLNYFYNL